MKKIIPSFSFLIFSLFIASSGFCVPSGRSAKIISCSGTVELQKNPQSAWEKADPQTALTQGFCLRTGKNSLAIVNVNGSGETALLTIKENTLLTFARLLKDVQEKTETTLLDLALGEIYIQAQKLHSQESQFEVKTPTSIVGVRGTQFSVTVKALK